MRGRVYGRPAGSLNDRDAGFGNAGSNRAGASGEMRTAAILDELANREDGPTVLHDLRIPGSNANIDHLIVSGTDIWIIDSKSWTSGFYLTWGGKVYQTGQPGKLLARFSRTDQHGKVTYPGEKKTLPFAETRLREFLRNRGLGFRIRGKFMVIWPSSGSTPCRVWAYRPTGATAMSGAWLNVYLPAARYPGDPVLVSHLTSLLIQAGA